MSDYDEWGIDEDEFEAAVADSAKYEAERGQWPAGTHRVILEYTERVPMQNDKGDKLNIRFRGDGGECNGRCHFESLNLWHVDGRTRSIAMSYLDKLVLACGLSKRPPGGPKDLEGLSLTLRIYHAKESDGKLKAKAAYVAPSQVKPSPAPARPAQQQRPRGEQPAPGAAPKWARKPAQPQRGDDGIPF